MVFNLYIVVVIDSFTNLTYFFGQIFGGFNRTQSSNCFFPVDNRSLIFFGCNASVDPFRTLKCALPLSADSNKKKKVYTFF